MSFLNLSPTPHIFRATKIPGTELKLLLSRPFPSFTSRRWVWGEQKPTDASHASYLL